MSRAFAEVLHSLPLPLALDDSRAFFPLSPALSVHGVAERGVVDDVLGNVKGLWL